MKDFDIFHVSLLKQHTTSKERVDEQVTELEVHNSKKYKVEAIWDSAVYVNKLESGKLSSLYYLIA